MLRGPNYESQSGGVLGTLTSVKSTYEKDLKERGEERGRSFFFFPVGFCRFFVVFGWFWWVFGWYWGIGWYGNWKSFRYRKPAEKLLDIHIQPRKKGSFVFFEIREERRKLALLRGHVFTACGCCQELRAKEESDVKSHETSLKRMKSYQALGVDIRLPCLDIKQRKTSSKSKAF